MKRVGFLCPGQGSQFVGMGIDFNDVFTSANSRFKEAEDILNFNLSDVMFNGPEDKLKQTYITQPSLYVFSAVVMDLLANHEIKPIMAAGHSLGEFSALYAAGAASFEDLLRLVKKRGELMQEAGEKAPGTMAAVIGADDESVEKLCAEARKKGIVQPANFNSPGQVVISGSKEGIAEAIALAKDFGARRAMELNVSGAFHSTLMEFASEGLNAQIDATSWSDAAIPVFANVTGKAETAKENLAENVKTQLLNPVRWTDTIKNMIEHGVDAFIEVGAGKVLSGLVKRIDKTVPCYTVGTVEEIESIDELVK